MKTSSVFAPCRVISPIVVAAVLWSCCSPPLAAQTFNSVADAISGSYFFPQRVVWVGDQPPDEGESRLLWEILDGWRMSRRQIGLTDMEMFLEAYTNSAWAPSLHANLGKYYHDIGAITPALEHWEGAWLATRDFVDGNGKMVGDYTLAHWTRLLASLGRYETLQAIFAETAGRVLDGGPLSQRWARTQKAFSEMGKRPGVSYKCGTYALARVARELNRNFNVRALMAVPSPNTGFSLKALVDFSTQLGLGLVPVARVSGNELVIPSIIHWEQDHYGAIVSLWTWVERRLAFLRGPWR